MTWRFFLGTVLYTDGLALVRYNLGWEVFVALWVFSIGFALMVVAK